jgi:hypothetical protein
LRTGPRLDSEKPYRNSTHFKHNRTGKEMESVRATGRSPADGILNEGWTSLESRPHMFHPGSTAVAQPEFLDSY